MYTIENLHIQLQYNILNLPEEGLQYDFTSPGDSCLFQ